ncbi:hypothetical protein BH10PLA1_BH10PLA1_08970 [soil metagenome]
MPTPSERRTLRFDSIDEAFADAESLAAAEQAGTLRTCGQWTLGQALGHLAAWVDYGFNGAPVKIPFFIPWIARPFRKLILSRTLPAGKNIPTVAGGTLAKDVISTEEGLVRFRKSFGRLKTESPSLSHLLLGRLNHDEWIVLNLRHAELHLSFMRCD